MHRVLAHMLPKGMTLIALLLAGVALAYAADTVEPSDDFLEYLGNMENSDDNWTDLAAANETTSSSAVTPDVNATPTSRMLNTKPVESMPQQTAWPTNTSTTAPATAPPVALKANK